jgi:Flp pilus assembly pilin Flp
VAPASLTLAPLLENESLDRKDCVMQPTVRLRALVRDAAGQDLIEYAMLAALLALATVVTTGILGQTLNDTFWTRIAGMLANLV